LRSGYVAGDRELLAAFRHYRTYAGAAMGQAVQAASVAAWSDEEHVARQRGLYRAKLRAFHATVAPVWPLRLPAGGFYFWMPTPGDERDLARRLFAEQGVSVLPGSFFSRAVDGRDPGAGHVRLALTGPLAECEEAARRVAAFLRGAAR
jgi:N-succinyldiaminopimelate aminotransferase